MDKRESGYAPRPETGESVLRDHGVDGKIVLAPGDVLLPFNTYVQTPVEITIEQGFIRDIRGGAGSSGLDADLLAPTSSPSTTRAATA